MGFLSSLLLLFKGFYYILEHIIFMIIPARKKDVKDDIVLITGAGSGIGRLMALNFASLGSTLVLWDVNKQGNEITASEVRERGAEAHTYVVDITNRETVYRVADQVKKDVGDVTILVNNAGIVAGNDLFLDKTDDLMVKTMEVNAIAHFWMVKAFLPAMVTANKGHLVTIASGAGLSPVPRLTDYCTSKYAAVGFHDSMVFEMDSLGKNGIKFTLVCPAFIGTGMFDGAGLSNIPMLKPEEVARQVVDAVRRNEDFIMLPRAFQYTLFLRDVLPLKAGLVFGKLVGVDSSMDNFRGREKRE